VKVPRKIRGNAIAAGVDDGDIGPENLGDRGRASQPARAHREDDFSRSAPFEVSVQVVAHAPRKFRIRRETQIRPKGEEIAPE